MRYRKKPVVIDARQFDGSWTCGRPILEWIDGSLPIEISRSRWSDCDGGRLHIPTLEGVMVASAGDWIIKGVKGEFYPCKPDIFAATYEPVDDATLSPEPHQ